MAVNLFEEFDSESQSLLEGMEFLDFGFEEKTGDKFFKAPQGLTQNREEALKNNPLGSGSIFAVIPRMSTTESFNLQGTKWIFKYEQSNSGTELLDLYRKYDDFLAKSAGSSDEIKDFILYIETDYAINLGKVLLIKMSNAMINYYFQTLKKDPATKLLNSWSQQIYELSKNKPGFSATVEDVEDAFLLEIAYRPQVNNGSIKLTNSEIGSLMAADLSQKIRAIKIDRENWDPTLKSDRYKYREGLSYIISSLNEFKSEIVILRKFLSVLKEISGELKLLTDGIAFLKGLEKEIALIIQILQEIKAIGPEYFAFLCGIVDGIFEFICGILDVIILVLRLIITTGIKASAGGSEFTLDLLELREGLEEFIEAFLINPNFLRDKIGEMLAAYNYSRRKDPKLTIYQIAHNNGEDIILLIDIIASFVAIVKGIVKSSEYFPKFTEWIDEVIENGGTGARNLEKSFLDDFIRLSDELVNATKHNILIQNSDDIEELYRAAKIAEKELKEITSNFASETRGKEGFRPELKSKARSLEKIDAEYDGVASRLVDIAASKVVYENIEDVYSALNKFNNKYKILKIKDRFQQPLNGYRDILINIEAKNGHIVEFRLQLTAIDDVSTGAGHKLYEKQRSIEAISKTRNLSKKEKIAIYKLKMEQFELYENAWKKNQK